jgi:hypothetical protein
MQSYDPVGIVEGRIISLSVKFWMRVDQLSNRKQTSVESNTAPRETTFDPSVLKRFQRLIKCHFNCPSNVT